MHEGQGEGECEGEVQGQGENERYFWNLYFCNPIIRILYLKTGFLMV